MIFGIIYNLALASVYYVWLIQRRNDTDTGELFLNDYYVENWWSSIALGAICALLFILSVAKQPGFLFPVYDFVKVVENAIDIDLHLDNLCTYCEVIKSEISVHCTICNRCVENYDHHCQFINNCIGHRNQKYFISFICLYTLFLLLILTETSRHLV